MLARRDPGNAIRIEDHLSGIAAFRRLVPNVKKGKHRRLLLFISLAALAVISACSSGEPSATAEPTSTPLPTATPFNTGPAPTPAPIDLENVPQDIIDGFGIVIVPFIEELQEQGQRSSLFPACKVGEPGAVPGAQFVSELASNLGDDIQAILNRGMGGTELACMVERQSSLGGSQITLIYDIINPGWITTERQLRAELDSSGIPEILIEGSYVEFEFFPSGSFRIPTLVGLNYPGELQMEMVFLRSDVVVNISDPNVVCGGPDANVPSGPADIGSVTEALGTDLEEALGISLARSCVTWSELGDVISLDLQFGSDTPPPGDPIPGLRALLESYGAMNLNAGGTRLRGGAGFSDAQIGGQSVTGTINLNGNDAFLSPDMGTVPAFMAVTATLQITRG